MRARALNCFSHVRLFATPWTAARQAPLSMGISRREYWRGLPCPPPGDLPNPGIKPVSHVCRIGSWVLYTSATWEAHRTSYYGLKVTLGNLLFCLPLFTHMSGAQR